MSKDLTNRQIDLLSILNHESDDCLTWRHKYGQVWMSGDPWNAYVIACALGAGPKPEKSSVVRRSCDNAKCINPRHLYWGTREHQDKTCGSCGREHPTVKFRTRLDPSGTTYTNYSKCRSCESQAYGAYAKTPEGRDARKKWKKRSSAADPLSYYVKDRIAGWRKLSRDRVGVESDLTTKYLVDLYIQQGGKCYYTGSPLELGAGVGRGRALPNSASLDRKDPLLGYVQGNVVWTSYRVNTSKGNLTEAEYYAMCQLIIKTEQDRS